MDLTYSASRSTVPGIQGDKTSAVILGASWPLIEGGTKIAQLAVDESGIRVANNNLTALELDIRKEVEETVIELKKRGKEKVMQWLANLSVRRSVFAAVIMLVIFVIGLASYRSLGVDFFPNVDFPIVAVITRLAGAAPNEVETDISEPIEAAINTISGIDELRLTSTEGVSQVYVMFKLDKDVNVAAQEVRDRISIAMPNLPQGIDQPVVMKVDPSSSPVIYLTLESDQPRRQ